MNDSISILVESLILAGGLIMFLAILGTRNILKEVKEPKYHKTWKFLLGLMILFLLGYLAAAYIVGFGNEKAIFIITGVIFFLGGIFVNIVVRTGYHTIQNLGTTINALEKMMIHQQKTEKSLQIKAAEILKLNEQLEQRVQERTEEVVDLNKSLKKHISDLENANMELDSFSYSVSHDLRSPLRTINGFTKLIERKYKDKIDEQGKEFMEIISDSTQKLEQLIDDLLSFSRLGKKELLKTEIDMNELVNSIVNGIDISQWNSKAKITVKEMLPSFGDKALLSQVFVNMLSNALKYSKNKEIPLIEIGSYSKENENVYYIKDNGVGFNMAQYDKLFKVFQRLHSDAEFQGSGVGLAIVDRIIKRHEGRVWAEGKVNEGATFYFALPIIPKEHPTTA